MPAPRPLRTLGVLAASAGLLGLIALAQSTMIDFEQRLAPIATPGETGQTVDTRQFTIEVTEVQIAGAITPADDVELEGAEPLEARGVWVVVWATMTSHTHEMAVSDAAMLEVADDYAFASPAVADTVLTGQQLDPGIPISGAIVFEVPEDRLAAPVLRVGADGGDDRLSAEAAIDLGLSDQDIASGVQSAAETTVEIPAPTHT